MIDPLEQLAADRASARAKKDGLANVGFLATTEGERPHVRILNLRDLPSGLAVFFNSTSPKAAQLQLQPLAELLIYLPTLQLQYRLVAETQPIPNATIAQFWPLRPEGAKRIDAVYESGMAQSTAVTDRAALLTRFHSVAVPVSTPPSASGALLAVIEVDRLQLNDADPPHARQRFRRGTSGWSVEELVP